MSEDMPEEIMNRDYYSILDKLDNISLFLEPTRIEGQFDYDNMRRPLVGKELSVGHIKEEHMEGHLESVLTALEMLDEGQIGLGLFIMKMMQSEFKMTMSIDGEFMRNVTKTEMSHTYTQHVYSHDDKEPVKKGWGQQKKG